MAGLGYAAGRRATSTVQVPPSAPPPLSAGATGAKQKLGRMVCASVQSRDLGEEELDALRLRAKWCSSELAELKRARDEARQPWPADEDSVEAPDLWTEAVEEALASCDIGADIELVDCTEYPCAAALRPAQAPPNAEAFRTEMVRLMEAVRACPDLRSAFNVKDDEHAEQALDVYRLDSPCGGRREDFFVLTAVEPDGPAHALLNADRDDKQERDFHRWLYRRADDVSAMWPCREE